MQADPEVEADQIARLTAWRAARDADAVAAALDALRQAARDRATNVMPASIAAAKAGRHHRRMGRGGARAFGEYRAPTGVGRAARRTAPKGWSRSARRSMPCPPSWGGGSSSSSASRASTAIPTAPNRSPPAPATAAWRSIYEGIRLTPAEIVSAAARREAHVVGPVDPVGQPPAADHRGAGPDARRGPGARAAGRRRDHPRRRRGTAARHGRRAPSTRPRISS